MQTTLINMNGELELGLPVLVEEDNSTEQNDQTDQPQTEDIEAIENEQEEELTSLTTELQRLRSTADFLYHRVNTLQTLLDQERFELSSYPLKVKSTSRVSKVRELLKALELEEEQLTMGMFLTALNKWLVVNEYIDLNDLQILMTPLLSAAFHKPAKLKKMPYPLLLLGLDRMFL